MVAGAILPIAIHNNKLVFLFGKEASDADTPGWSDFGGGVEGDEDPYKTALREGGEELSGYLGDGANIERLIKAGGGCYKLTHKTYHIHMFLVDYDENLPKYYNQNHKFLWERMDQKYLHETRLFEKGEIAWLSAQDMKRRRSEFRAFYQEITDHILEEMPKIEAFIRTNGRKRVGFSRRPSQKSKKTRKMRGSIK